MAEVVRPSTAFSLDAGGRRKRQRFRADGHLDFIRTLPCVVCMARGVEAAHIRYRDVRYGKRGTGKGEKPDDCYVVPLCPEHHRDQHQVNEAGWWREQMIDPIRVALALFSRTGDEVAAKEILAWAKT